MKKLAVVALAALAFSACHFGKDEASSSVERNKKYKEATKETGPEINPDYIKGGAKPAADTATKTADTAASAATQTPSN
ncbi:MAG TPA: hypothetical protein VEC12_08125 [Bacteroidia bacterium]|nr:hypothetical protein [Bacteroidia bacterium]